MVAATEPDRARSVLLLYGTETGTSQDFAEEIGRCLERLHFDTDVAGLDDVNYALLKSYTFTVFVLSTTGQGDFPENARKFWTSLLRKKLPPTTLAGIKYALVGLGDSSYPKFNWAARKLDKRLRQLGAASILESCEADEQGDEGTDGYFLAWLDLFRKTVLTLFPLPEGLNPIPNEVLLPSKYRLEGTLTSHESQAAPKTAPTTDISSDSFPVVLEKNERMTPAEHWQDVRFMRLKTVTKKLEYMPGDALAILPQNMPTDVSFLIDRMNWHDVADIPVRLVPTRSSGRLPRHPISTRTDLTLRILLTEYLDINAIPRRSFFGAIANYTDNEMHKERLLEFTDPQYLDEYYDYATRPRRSMLEILQEFDSVHIPWEEVTNIFPPLRARQFSIASGGALKHGDSSTIFELLVAIVKYRTVIKRIREGVCTRYLARLPVGTTLQVSLKTEGRFSKSSDPSGENHILVGAGTGIAPLRALIHEKARHGLGSPSGSGRTALFFGCRSEKADYFFHDEWVALSANSNITPAHSNNNAEERFETDGSTTNPTAVERLDLQVIPAFSRDQKNKVYVQDRIREHSELIWELLRNRDATVIVCGSSGAMPKAVRQAIVDALVKQGRERLEETETTTTAAGGGPVGELKQDDDDEEDPITSEQAAEMYLARLEKVGRYKQETWS